MGLTMNVFILDVQICRRISVRRNIALNRESDVDMPRPSLTHLTDGSDGLSAAAMASVIVIRSVLLRNLHGFSCTFPRSPSYRPHTDLIVGLSIIMTFTLTAVSFWVFITFVVVAVTTHGCTTVPRPRPRSKLNRKKLGFSGSASIYGNPLVFDCASLRLVVHYSLFDTLPPSVVY